MQTRPPNYYATLGLDPSCTTNQIRAAYRLLAKQLHPDVNSGLAEAMERTQEINAAYEILSDPARRRFYDDELASAKRLTKPARAAKVERNISQEVHLRIDEFFRGTSLEVRVNDPANPDGLEQYELTVPSATAPGTRFRLSRVGHFEGGYVLIRVRARPDFRFKVRGSDLRCDLSITTQRAAQGGSEMVQGPITKLRLQIPRGVSRNEIVRVVGEGLPKPRGGRGDLLVRIIYRIEVRVSRSSKY